MRCGEGEREFRELYFIIFVFSRKKKEERRKCFREKEKNYRDKTRCDDLNILIKYFLVQYFFV
jgi:hypothetical protein